MRKYFVKYLPVAAEVLHKSKDLFMVRQNEDEDWAGVLTRKDVESMKWNFTMRVAAHLITHKIKPGDVIWDISKMEIQGIAVAFWNGPTVGFSMEGAYWECVEKDSNGDIIRKSYVSTKNAATSIGTLSPDVTWLKDFDVIEEHHTTYNQDTVDLIEKLRLDFEARTGFRIGSWVKDSEDGYKRRYQGQIYQYKENSGSLQIFYGSAEGGSWGYEEHIEACTPEQIAANRSYVGEYGYGQYGIHTNIKVKCSQCQFFH